MKEKELNIPFPKGIKYEISHPKGEYAHENYSESKYAIDFLVPEGTPVTAAHSGKVFKTKSDSDKWGLDKELAKEANFVAIKHDDGTYAEYIHLGKDKVLVKEGQAINKDDLIGYTGLSGLMDKPHLHFNVFTVQNNKAKSIPIKFEEQNRF